MIEETVRLLVAARQLNQPTLAAEARVADAQTAYAVQEAVGRQLGWFEDGAPPRYWKTGGAEYTHAALPPKGVWHSPANAGDWPFQFRCIEAEIGLRLAQDVDRSLALSLQPEQAASLVDAMCAMIEVVDSRWVEGLDAGVWHKLGDLQSHGAQVVGEWVPFEQRDWREQLVRVAITDQPLFERRGSHRLVDPTLGLPLWLRHATRNGQTVPAGTMVTTGTWCGMLSARAGDLVTVEYPGIGQASVQF